MAFITRAGIAGGAGVEGESSTTPSNPIYAGGAGVEGESSITPSNPIYDYYDRHRVAFHWLPQPIRARFQRSRPLMFKRPQFGFVYKIVMSFITIFLLSSALG